MNAANLPLTNALARFGDVPTSFVMREMEDARECRELERDLKEWLEDLATRNLGDAFGPGSHASHSKPAAFRRPGVDPYRKGWRNES
jgi:uncharacterized ferritin-like protein (DUF455 family)